MMRGSLWMEFQRKELGRRLSIAGSKEGLKQSVYRHSNCVLVFSVLPLCRYIGWSATWGLAHYESIGVIIQLNTPTQNKPEIPQQAVCHRQEPVISEQLPMMYCNTWLRSLLCDIKKFVHHRGVCYENVSLK